MLELAVAIVIVLGVAALAPLLFILAGVGLYFGALLGSATVAAHAMASGQWGTMMVALIVFAGTAYIGSTFDRTAK